MRREVEDEGVTFVSAKTPDNARQLIKDLSPDLLVVSADGMSAELSSLCSDLKSHKATEDISILFIVEGDSPANGMIEALRSGADECLPAGLGRSLRAKVTRLITSRRGRRALQEAEARYRSLIEALPAVVYVSEAEAPFIPIYVSPEAESLGYPIEAWRKDGELWFKLLHAADRERIFPPSETIHTARRAGRYEYRLMASDGSIRWFHDSGRYVRDEAGRLICWQGVMVDITERKQAEEAVRISEERYRDLVESSEDLLCTHNLEGRILSVNRGSARLLGYEPQELLAKSIRDILAPEVRHEFDDYIDRLKRDGVASGTMLVLKRDGGRMLWQYRNSLRTQGVDHPVVRGMAHDITDRWRVERELRQSEERYREIFEIGLTGVFVASPAGEILACNRAFAGMLGFESPQDLLGSPISACCPDSSKWNDCISMLASEGKVENCEAEMTRKDGKPVFVIGNLAARRDKEGALVEIHGYLFDNTERRQLEEQLRQSQRLDAVGRLAGGVAHDFNNLLTAVIGYSQLLETRLGGDPQGLKEVGEIRKAGERAASLTRQLLAFSRRQILQLRVLNLNSIVTEMSKLLRRLISENIDLTTTLAADLGSVRADPGQVEHVIVNLVVNARDAMPSGGKLIIETSNVDIQSNDDAAGLKAGPYVMMEFSDTGRGMDAETRARIFEPFFSTKDAASGAGLGMSAVYGIVKQTGGTILVDSTPAKGTTLRVYLPRFLEGRLELPAELQTEVLASFGGSETVLLVEDEESVRALARDSLQAAGYKVLEAATVDEALIIAERYAGVIHIILSDLVMPQMGGRELMRLLTRGRPDARALYMSGYNDSAILNTGSGAAPPFLQKPFTPTDLIKKVREVLDSITP